MTAPLVPTGPTDVDEGRFSVTIVAGAALHLPAIRYELNGVGYDLDGTSWRWRFARRSTHLLTVAGEIDNAVDGRVTWPVVDGSTTGSLAKGTTLWEISFVPSGGTDADRVVFVRGTGSIIKELPDG